jgi:hypothetical protein
MASPCHFTLAVSAAFNAATSLESAGMATPGIRSIDTVLRPPSSVPEHSDAVGCFAEHRLPFFEAFGGVVAPGRSCGVLPPGYAGLVVDQECHADD